MRRTLLRHDEPVTTGPRRTSRPDGAHPTSSWLSQRGIDGGIDEVPLPTARGRLSLCGKHAIGPDAEAALRRAGATTVVCLVEEHELSDRYPQYVQWLRATPGTVWFPIHDLHAPSVEAVRPLLHDLVARLERDEHLLVHCAAGIGRSGTVAVCLLMELGLSPDEALGLVARSRPMAGPEVGAQRDLVTALAARITSP
jgi:protein-tyrosine phosphatase